jgi:hypothetical protein
LCRHIVGRQQFSLFPIITSQSQAAGARATGPKQQACSTLATGIAVGRIPFLIGKRGKTAGKPRDNRGDAATARTSFTQLSHMTRDAIAALPPYQQAASPTIPPLNINSSRRFVLPRAPSLLC